MTSIINFTPPALCASQCLRGSLRSFRFGSYSLLLHGEWMVNGKWYTILQKPLFVRLHVIKRKGLREWNSEKPDIVCFTTRENWLLDFQVVILPLKNEFVIHDERGLFWIAFWIQLRWKNMHVEVMRSQDVIFYGDIFSWLGTWNHDRFHNWRLLPLCYSHVLSQILSKYLLSMAKIDTPNVLCFGLLGLTKNGRRKISPRFPKLKSWDLQMSGPNQRGFDSRRKPWNYFEDDLTSQ